MSVTASRPSGPAPSRYNAPCAHVRCGFAFPALLLEQLAAASRALTAASSTEQLSALTLGAAQRTLGAAAAVITAPQEDGPEPPAEPHLSIELHAGRPVGALHLRFDQPRELSAAERQFLEALAAPLAASLERLQDRKLRRSEQDQLRGQTEALDAFARFTELSATTSDVPMLALRAAEVLRTTLGDVSAAYLRT